MPGPTHLAIAYPGAIPYGAAPAGASADMTRAGIPASASLVPGAGAEIPFEELTCSAVKLDGSGPCNAPRMKDDDVCVAHARAREKRQKRGS